MRQLFTFALVLITYVINAQSIENVRAVQDGQKIMINYDIVNSGTNQKFDINVYCSKNGGHSFGLPLEKVKGDVGKNISGGLNKSITWFVLEEWGELISPAVKFKIQADIKTTKVANDNKKNTTVGTNNFNDLRDNHSYAIISVSGNNWLGSNLNFQTTDGCFCYEEKDKNCDKYGQLYDWETAMNVCPSGWHLPSKAEFQKLIDYFGGPEEAYQALIINGSSNMNIDFGGMRLSLGIFQKSEAEGRFWTSTDIGGTNAYGVIFDRLGKTITFGLFEIGHAYSVRCVQ
jgi:uncharacterized protein (TIGR02145 family)